MTISHLSVRKQANTTVHASQLGERKFQLGCSKQAKTKKKPQPQKHSQNKNTFTARHYSDLDLSFCTELMTFRKYNIQKYAGMYNILSQPLIRFLYLTPFVDGKLARKVNE